MREQRMSCKDIAAKVGCDVLTAKCVCDPAAKAKRAAYAREYRNEHLVTCKQSANNSYAKHCEARIATVQVYRNSDQGKAKIRQYREENKECISTHKQEYNKKNAKHIKERRRLYNEEHAEYNSEWRRKRYLAHQEEEQAAQRQYSKTLTGRIVNCNANHKRREQMKHGAGLTVKDFEGMWREQAGKCYYCGKVMLRYEDVKNTLFKRCYEYCRDYCTVDHVIPLSKGGLHDPQNVVLACRECNSKKNTDIWVAQGSPVGAFA